MIHTVTITGADDKTDLKDLKELSLKYPFVEWGILFSSSKAGTQRYPSVKWVEQLSGTNLRYSAHICGELCRAFLIGDDHYLNYANIWFYHIFSRMQLNFNSKNSEIDIFEFIKLLNKAQTKSRPGFNVILQYNEANRVLMDMFIKYNPSGKTFLHYLYDASGGRGKGPQEWSGVLNAPTGYAGGLTPDNLDDELKKILSVTGDTSIWIDAESGVRTDNEFDINKVEKFLAIASAYVSTDLKNNY